MLLEVKRDVLVRHTASDWPNEAPPAKPEESEIGDDTKRDDRG